MKIFKIKPSFSERLWGGQGLTKLGFKIDENKKIGEAWVISAHENGMGFIQSDDEFNGISLKDFFNNNRSWFGNFIGDYPMLVKIITPEDYLSVQVHPNDEYAMKHHNSLGKPESWYVLDCPKNAELIYGHNAKTKEEFESLIKQGDWDKLMKKIPINKGDFIYVDAGKIHAITPGVVVYELQRSSDITYRMYDYDRVDSKTGLKRDLNIKESVDNAVIPDNEGVIIRNANNLIFESDYFSLFKLNIDGEKIWTCPEKTSWYQLTIISGNGKINDILFNSGDNAICVENPKELKITGVLEVLISWKRD